MCLSDIDNLLLNFELLPKNIKQTTYLELCKYPRHRFEEICSRILCFYLAPKKEHGFNDLFLRSLLKLISPQKEYYIKNEKIHVISEENAEGKRLDLLIYSDNFVIGIENKITASLNNPLEAYKNRIHLYGNDNIFRVVLSLRKFTSQKEIKLLETHNFISLTYLDYFKIIKDNIGFYINDCNEKYLIYLKDFMETLENMSGHNILNEELANYFYENSDKIESLVDLFNQFNEKTKSLQVARIEELREKISKFTDDTKWWVWEGWDLGYNEFIFAKAKVGIECYFRATKGNALGKFNITITAWSLKDWRVYEEKILQAYPKAELERVDDRAFLHVETIHDDDEIQILNSLNKYYHYLLQLTSENLEIDELKDNT